MTLVPGCEGILQIRPAENFCPTRAPDSPGLLFRTHLETVLQNFAENNKDDGDKEEAEER